MKKKKVIAIILCLLAVGIPSSVYAYNSYNYNKFYNEGQADLKEEKFDEAISDFNSALKYGKKHSEEIKQEIGLINKLKVSKAIFQDAEKQMKDKKYLEAIDTFKKVIKEDTKRYSLAQQKADECKNSYINDNLEKAKKEATSKKYQDAIKYLELVIKIDSKNEQALKLKDEYNKAIQKQKEEEEKARKVQEEKARKAAEEKRKVEEEKARKVEETKKVASKETVKIGSGGMTIYKEDGKWSAYSLNIHNSPYLTSMEFRVIRLGSIPHCDYKAVVHVNGKEQVYTGKTSQQQYTSVRLSNVPRGIRIPIDVYITYKGKEYKFTKKYSLR